MATSFSGMALWEAMRSLRGLFSSGSADISITQQQASALLPTRDDEAIQLALDAALQGLGNGPLHLERVQSVREALEPHQRADWRVNIGSLKMTERFEQVMISKTTTRTNSASGEQPEQQDGALQQRRRGSGTRGQERTEEKFDRRQRDYEWTEEDPRIKHLILVSKLVEKGGVAKAKAYLLAAGLIKAKSLKEQGSDALSNAQEAAAEKLYQLVAAKQLDSGTYDRIMQLPEGDARDRELSIELAYARRAAGQRRTDMKRTGLHWKTKLWWSVGVALILALCFL